MLRSRTQLVKSHGDDLSLEYLWNGDEYGSLQDSLKAIEKNAEYAGQPEILAQVHVIERPITVHYEDSDKGTVIGEFFTDRPSIDIFIIQTNVKCLIVTNFFSTNKQYIKIKLMQNETNLWSTFLVKTKYW